MGDFQPLALTRENDGVVTNDVAGSDRAETNGVAIPRTGPAFAAENRDLGKITAQCLGHDLSQTERRARRRIDLVTMMRFDYLAIGAVAQRLGRRLGQFESEVHTGRKI